MHNDYYHVDALGTLQTGAVIDARSNGWSKFGLQCVSRFRAAGLLDALERSDIPSSPAINALTQDYRREFFLEHIRRHHPLVKNRSTSRLNSFFAVKSMEDARSFIVRRPTSVGRVPRIFIVHTDGDHPAHDMNWLDFKFPDDPNYFAYHYVSYWNRVLTTEDQNMSGKLHGRLPIQEVLITSPVTIGAIVG
ncbi:hypothetical protein [Burkholderia gladioli]|uniref:hypothetical protein n=1 Tax=Burkholderia gladioli TaxID=28095 RepID=UPI00163ED79D|nr:hypothetical protein [Burkholderia gladioli]MDN7754736.1 hypothetical protein [Burkholderia gladioli]